MAKKKKQTVPLHQNFVHKNMVLIHKPVAHESLKDYDRKRLKRELKQEY